MSSLGNCQARTAPLQQNGSLIQRSPCPGMYTHSHALKTGLQQRGGSIQQDSMRNQSSCAGTRRPTCHVAGRLHSGPFDRKASERPEMLLGSHRMALEQAGGLPSLSAVKGLFRELWF